MSDKEKAEEKCSSVRNGILSSEEIIEDITKDLNEFVLNKGNSANKNVADENINTNSEAAASDGYHIPEVSEISHKDEDLKEDDDFIDEDALKDAEQSYSEEDKERLRCEAEKCKLNGNEQFKAGNYQDSALSYTKGLRICPLAYSKDRAIMHSNRAAAKVKMGLKPGAIEDCTKAVKLDSSYLKAYQRRAQLYEETEKLDEALSDYQAILQLDPLHREALHATKRLSDLIQERNEKLKADMFAKLKDLGNMLLRPFNLSTDNFQLTQDPQTGGYSVSFQQNK